MSSDQDTCGFLPPNNTSFTDELHRQPSSSTTTRTGNNPHHLPPDFTTLNIASPDATTPGVHLAAALGRAIFSIPSTSSGDAVPATTAINTHNPIYRTLSDISSSDHQELTTTTSTPPKAREPPRRNPIRRTVSDIISTDHQEQRNTTAMPPRAPTPPLNSRTTGPGFSNGKDSSQFKRLKKIEEMVTEIEQRCWEARCESGVTEAHIEDDNPSEAIVEQEEEEVREQFVVFERLEDGGLRIRLSCSCGNCFELLHNHNGCFYRLS